MSLAQNVRPNALPFDVANDIRGDAIQAGDDPLRAPVQPNGGDLVLSQFCSPNPRAERPATGQCPIPNVFLSGRLLQMVGVHAAAVVAGMRGVVAGLDGAPKFDFQGQTVREPARALEPKLPIPIAHNGGHPYTTSRTVVRWLGVMVEFLLDGHPACGLGAHATNMVIARRRFNGNRAAEIADIHRGFLAAL